MQDSLVAFVNPSAAEAESQVALKCPRCESMNTKFCYYNNYNLSQPRHFCKNCRRYWTKGGALRNVPVGGGTRKNSSKRSNSTSNIASNTKRPSTSTTSTVATSDKSNPDILNNPEPLSLLYPNPADDKMLDFSGNNSFSSLLHSNIQFPDINLLDSFDHHHHHHHNISSSAAVEESANINPSNEGDGSASGSGDNMLSWVNGWPDLAIYTPGSTFQ